MTNTEIQARGRLISSETATGGNTAARVGGVIEAIGQNLETNATAISNEASAREHGDSTLNGLISAETTARQAADETLQDNIDDEINARRTAISNEESAREHGDSTLSGMITAEASARQSADETLQDNIDAEASARRSAISNEESAREHGDSTLSGMINAEASSRQSADATLQDNIDAEVSARQTAISNEESAREHGDSTLSGMITAEANTRQSADATLQDNIDAEESARQTAISNEATARSNAVTALGNALNNEQAARQSADAALQDDIEAEASARQTAVSDEAAARTNAVAAVVNALSEETSARISADVALQQSIEDNADDIGNAFANIGYFVCDTAGATAAKTISAPNYVLQTGGNMRIKMTNANTAANVTLNINGVGAKALFYNGAQTSSDNSWEAGEVLEVYYDGTQYQASISKGGGAFATGEQVADTGIDEEPTENSDNLVKSGGVYDAIPFKAEVGEGNHFVDFVDDQGYLLFYIGTDFVFHALGNTSENSLDTEIPSKGLVITLIENAIAGIQPTSDSDLEFKEGDNDHVLDVCDENGYLLFYVDSDFTFHAIMDAASFHLPDVINSYVGDTLQIFYYPMLLTPEYRKLGVNLYIEGEPLLSKNFGRYSEYSPSSAGTKTMKCTILDDGLGIVSTKELSLNVVTPSSPSSMKNILLIGDSETEGYVNNSTVSPSADGQTNAMRYPYATELQRILTGSDTATDTAPAGLALSNIQLIGTSHAGIRHEGYGGKTAAWFMGANSPFYKNGAINFDTYLGQDSIYSDTSEKGVDYIYILLGANEGCEETVLGGKLILTANAYKNNMISLLNAIKSQIVNGSGTYANPNLKVILLSYVISNPTGGAYHVLGEGQYYNGMRQPLGYYKQHEVNNELAAMDDYSSFVESVYISPQVDSEYAYAYINKQVNRYSEDTEKVYVENIHPNTIGYKMYGQAVARDVLSRIVE